MHETDLDPGYPLELLERFARYVDYDPERTRFTMFSRTYNMTRVIERIPFINEHDPTGKLACIYVKHAFAEELRNTKLTMFDIVNDDSCIADDAAMWDEFNSPFMTQIERDLADSIATVVNSTAETPLIGDADEMLSDLVTFVDKAVDGLHACQTHVWLASGCPMSRITAFPTIISVFDSVAACLATIESGPDGLVFAYVRQERSADGFFGFFAKSNGNIVSIDDLICEQYPGQHGNMRNGRYLEDHAFGLFPYSEIVRMSNPDYKGYYANYDIDESKLALLALPAETFLPIVLAMSCIANKLEGYVTVPGAADNMMVTTLPSAEGLVLHDDDALVLANDPARALDFTADDVKTGKLLTHRGKDSWEPYRTAMATTSDLVTAYAPDIDIDLDAVSVQGTGEFVQSLDGMRKVAYMRAREQLARAVLDELVNAIDDIGGAEGARAWFNETVQANAEHVRNFIACYYATDPEPQEPNSSAYGIGDDEYRSLSLVTHVASFAQDHTPLDTLKRKSATWTPYLVDESGTRETLVFAFKPTNAHDIAAFLGCSLDNLPRAVQHWSFDGELTGYNGNSILDVVDPVGELKHPLAGYGTTFETNRKHSWREVCSFECQVGFTKRAMKARQKALGLI